MRAQSSSRSCRPSKTRCGVTRPLKRVRGTGPIGSTGRVRNRLRGAAQRRHRLRPDFRGAKRLQKIVQRAARHQVERRWFRLARPTPFAAVESCPALRSGRAALRSAPRRTHRRSRRGGSSAARPNAPSGTPAIARNPLMTVNSHSGLLRSSGYECSRAACLQNCVQSPGGGNATCRTWNSRSKFVILDPVRMIGFARDLDELGAENTSRDAGAVRCCAGCRETEHARPARSTDRRARASRRACAHSASRDK